MAFGVCIEEKGSHSLLNLTQHIVFDRKLFYPKGHRDRYKFCLF